MRHISQSSEELLELIDNYRDSLIRPDDPDCETDHCEEEDRRHGDHPSRVTGHSHSSIRILAPPTSLPSIQGADEEDLDNSDHTEEPYAPVDPREDPIDREESSSGEEDRETHKFRIVEPAEDPLSSGVDEISDHLITCEIGSLVC